MKTLIIILIISSFIQTTIIPLDLVLIILISRSYIKSSAANLYLALGFGLLISHLNLNNLGMDSLTYILAVQITQVLSKTRLTGNSLLIFPITFILLSFSHLVSSLILHQSVNLFPKVLIESLISLPIFYGIRLWEERFIVRKEIKLKV